MMKAILVDDEQLALDFLERLLIKIGNINIIGKYVNPIVGQEKIMEHTVDVVFLDIDLPEINGLELAEQILQSKPDVTIVFVTAYNEYAVQAFELNAIDYVVKPVRIDRLAKTMKRIETNIGTELSDQPDTNSYIRVNVCWNLSIETKKGEFEWVPWRTAKAQELFLYLLHNRGQLVRKSFLVELLWQELDPERAYSQLYTAIYHVRKTLNQFPNHFEIKNTTDGYILSTRNIILDIEEWKNKLLAAPSLNLQTITTYIDIMSIYKGAYLQEYNYWWAVNDQYRWGQLWLKNALQIAGFYRDQGNMAEAKRWYTRICKEQPESEEAHFSLMKIYATEDNRVYVLKQYRILTNVLQEELGVPPSPEITKWFMQWEKLNNQFM